jgi:hypothetical protein
MIDPETVAVTLEVTSILEKLQIPYGIGGSVASSIYGIVRATMDVDMVADIRPEQVAKFVTILQDKFYIDEPSVRQAVSGRGAFNLIHFDTMVKIDVFVRKEREFDRQQLSRRVSEQVSTDPGETLWILSPEDVILAKLDWYRLGGEVSERQWRDVLGVLKTQAGHLDKTYLQKWAGELGVEDLLSRALNEM